MAKLSLSYSDKLTRADVMGLSSPLTFVLNTVLGKISSHPKSKAWREWSGVRPSSVGLLFCTDAEIRTYNREYRKMDKATDVLSFPALEMFSAGPPVPMKGYLGDLVISTETVRRAARRVRRPYSDELVEVFVHGILHLLGFDHVKVKRTDAFEMKSLQAELFAGLRAPIKKRYGSFVQKR